MIIQLIRLREVAIQVIMPVYINFLPPGIIISRMTSYFRDCVKGEALRKTIRLHLNPL